MHESILPFIQYNFMVWGIIKEWI